MCDCHDYNPFPSVTIGGPPGDYVLPAPVTSNEFFEFQIVSVAVVGVNPGVVLVSGVREQKAIDTSGASTYNGENNNTSIRAHVIPVAPNSFLPVLGPWEQVASPNRHLFVRIDGVIAAFVTIKMRDKILRAIPAPFITNHPQLPQETHLEREKRIRKAVWGEEGEAIEYGREPVEHERIRGFRTANADPPFTEPQRTRRGG
jgi:hypothetical protein